MSSRASIPGHVRIESIDMVRGVISDHHSTILHALDHAFLRTRSPSADRHRRVYLSAQKPKHELAQFLFTRGLWLIFLELVLFRCLGFSI
jgi:hypothetical protein